MEPRKKYTIVGLAFTLGSGALMADLNPIVTGIALLPAIAITAVFAYTKAANLRKRSGR